jgi:eukaryotic-like serine/threonine-protein kinase
MRPGDSINGYVLTTDFTSTGGGHCQWAFAKRGGEEFFVKKFLAPTYPLPGGPGSEKTKAAKRNSCERFATHHTSIREKLAPLSSTGGNLVVTRDFFLHDAHYYKVTARVNVGTEEVAAIAALPLIDRITLMIAVLRSVDILHRSNLVHGDIKPQNILIEATGTALGAKLIDFDNCFVAGAPPAPDELVGDLLYYAPEMADYIVGVGKPERLVQRSDVFALGLTFTQFLTGELPGFSNDQRYPGEVLRQDGELQIIASGDGARLTELLQSMLAADPTGRPESHSVAEALVKIRKDLRGHTSGSTTTAATGTMRGRLLSQIRAAEAAIPVTATPTEVAPAMLRGSLVKARADVPPAPATSDGKLRGSLARRARSADAEAES